MNHPKFISVRGSVYQLVDQPPRATERKGSSMTFRGRRWEFGISDGHVVFVSDSIRQGDDAERDTSPEQGVLTFLARIALSDHEADLESAKEFTVAIGDSPEAEEAFSTSVRAMRNDSDALYKLIHCLFSCPRCGNKFSASKSSAKHVLENITRYFDFSDVWTFLSSFEHLPGNFE